MKPRAPRSAGVRGRSRLPENLCQLGVRDHFGQAVAAQQDLVAVGQADPAKLDGDFSVLRGERTGEHVPQSMPGGGRPRSRGAAPLRPTASILHAGPLIAFRSDAGASDPAPDASSRLIQVSAGSDGYLSQPRMRRSDQGGPSGSSASPAARTTAKQA